MKALFFSLLFGAVFGTSAEAGDLRKVLADVAVARKTNPPPASSPVRVLEPVPHVIRVTARRPFLPRSDAKSCGTKIFQEKLGETRNQDGLGWCAGMVAADLLSNELGYRVSDFDLSLRTFSRFAKKKLGPKDSLTAVMPKYITRAIDTAIEEGVCAESGMPSNDRVLAELAAAKEAEGNALTPEDLAEGQARTIKNAIQVMEQVRGLSALKLTTESDLGCDAIGFTASMFPKLSELQILSGLTNSSTNQDLFTKFVDQSCERQKVVFAPARKFKHLVPAAIGPARNRGYHLLRSLDQRVNAERPVAIVYQPNKFFVDESDEFHTSIVVGREFRDGECKYLVRNSYGNSCGYYRDPYGSPRNCARGHFWMSEKDFAESVKMLEFLE